MMMRTTVIMMVIRKSRNNNTLLMIRRSRMGMTRMADTLNDEGESLSQFQFLNFYFMKIDLIRERELLQMLIALSLRKQYHVRKRKKIYCVSRFFSELI